MNVSSDAAYPREGTVTSQYLKTSSTLLMQLSPARGRLRPTRRDLFRCCTVMQLIPARGRLHDFERELYGSFNDAAYPREGTVTLLLTWKKSSTHVGCSLAPRGDGYQNSRVSCPSIGMQLIPARGRIHFVGKLILFHFDTA